MSNSKKVYISAISHKCGDWLPINELPEMLANKELASYMKNLGMRRYSKFSGSLYEVAEQSIRDTLEKAALNAGSIDAVVFFSTTFDTYVAHSDVFNALANLNLDGVKPYGVFHNQCVNYSQAIELCQMLIETDKASNVLVFGYDALNDDRSSRVLPNNTSVYSDVFVSFIVSNAEPASGYQVMGIENHFHPQMLQYQDSSNQLKFLTQYSAMFSKACQKVYETTKSSPNDFSWFITANYNTSVVRNLSDLAGMPYEKTINQYIAKYAHCFAADQLISLQLSASDINANEQVLIAGVGGFVVFNAIALRKIGK